MKDRLNQILSKHTGQLLSKLEKDTDRDFHLTAQEARTYGLIDDIIKSKKRAGRQKDKEVLHRLESFERYLHRK